MPLLVFLVALLAIGRPVGAQPTDTSHAVGVDSAAIAARRAASVDIAVGDRIAVKIWREPGLSDSAIVVDERGDVVLARVGTMRVAGHSISDVQDSLRLRFSEYLRNPSVSVTVYRRVGVQGEVRKPGLYYVDVTMTLREVLALAGGVTENGNASNIAIVRDGHTVPLGAWRRGGPMSADLRSGDQVVVASRSWLSRNALAAVSTAGLVISVLLSVLKK